MGLVMPLVATVVPMRRTLSRTLAESLNLYHTASNETKVVMQKLEDLGLSPSQVVGLLALLVQKYKY